MKTLLTSAFLCLVVITTQAQDLKLFSVGNGDFKKYGYKDEKGKIVVQAKYDGAAPDFYEGMAIVILKGKRGFIEKTGKGIAVKYDDVVEFSEGLAGVELNNKWGFIDKTGKVIIPLQLQYANVGNFHEGLASFGLNDKWGFIDKTGKEVIPAKYDDSQGFSEGLAAVKLNGRCGFIDKTGKEIIPLQLPYEGVGSFHEGLAKVYNSDYKTGFIDIKGKEIIPLQYDGAEDFKNGKAKVELNGRNFYIDKTGKEVK